MNERRLRIVYELARSGNMTETAGRLFISQPAVSKAIKEIEEELGVRLFERLGRKMTPTYAGEVYVSYVRRMLNLYDESVAAVRDIRDMSKGRLRIGASTTIGVYVLPDIVGQFLRAHPGVDVAITIENTRIVADMLRNNELDFAFVEGPVHDPEFTVREVCPDRLVMICAADHPWAQEGSVASCRLADEKMIMRERGSGTREVFEAAMLRHEVSYHISLELGNTEAIKNAVQAGLGVACVSYRCIRQELEAGQLGMTELSGVEMARSFYLVHHEDKHLSPLLVTFIQFARDILLNDYDEKLLK